MACPAIATGPAFLVQTLAHLDCQAQSIGSFGFQALAQPGSLAFAVTAGLLTIFIAIFGIRLMFGEQTRAKDLVDGVLKIGIVLTLASSWPAFKTLAYDTVVHGPAEVANIILPAAGVSSTVDVPQRLQAVDNAIAMLTFVGTGRQTAAPINDAPASSFRSIALPDEEGLGWARPLFLASVIGPLGALRIAAGLLLAIAPLVAGLLLFNVSRPIFVGWLQGLFLIVLGSVGVMTLLSVQLAVLEPWLSTIASRRSLGYSAPTAPTELLALVLGFATAQGGLLAILSRMAFRQGAAVVRQISSLQPMAVAGVSRSELANSERNPAITHSEAVRRSIESSLRREEASTRQAAYRTGERRSPESSSTNRHDPGETALSASYRRTSVRSSRSSSQRDKMR